MQPEFKGNIISKQALPLHFKVQIDKYIGLPVYLLDAVDVRKELQQEIRNAHWYHHHACFGEALDLHHH